MSTLPGRSVAFAAAVLLTLGADARAATPRELDDALGGLRESIVQVDAVQDCAAATTFVAAIDARLLGTVALAPVVRDPASPQRALLRPFVEALATARKAADPAECRPERFSAVHRTLELLAPALDESLDAAFRAPALVVSGGVSFGSYQAGFVAALARHLRKVEEALGPALGGLPVLGAYAGRTLNFEVAAGASAGSINALLGPMEACRTALPSLAGSTLFRAWVEVGLEQLFRNDRSTALSLFDRAVVEQAAALATAGFADVDGWREGCGFHFGATTTRLDPRFIRVGGTDLPKLTEKFRVELRAAEPRVRWLEEGPFWAGAAPDFAAVTQVLLASSSFPFAFAPVVMDYTVGGETFRRAQMLDGGALNNNPLDVLRSIERARGGPARSAQYVFFDQDLTESPQPVPVARASRTLVEAYSPLAEWIVGTTGTLQFVAPLESDPALLDRVETPRRSLASPSEYVSAMSGFFERDFRVFDFYRGFSDGLSWAHGQELVGRLLGVLGTSVGDVADPSPGLACVRSGDPASKACETYLAIATSPALACVKSNDPAGPACIAARHAAERATDASHDLAPACVDSRDPASPACTAHESFVATLAPSKSFAAGAEGENPSNVVALLAAARALTDRRIDACAGSRDVTPECAALYSRIDPFADELARARTRLPSGAPVGYRFRDLGDLRGEASATDFKLAVRAVFSDAVSAIANRQVRLDVPGFGLDQSLLVHTVAEFGLDQLILRRPRPFTWGLLFGQSAEIYGLLRLPLLPDVIAGDIGFRAAFRYAWSNWWVPEGAGATGARNRHDLSLIPQVMVGIPLPGGAFRLEGLGGLNFRRGMQEGWEASGVSGFYLGFESGLNLVFMDRIEFAYKLHTNLAWTPAQAIDWDTPGDPWIRARTKETFVNLRQLVSFGIRF